MYGLFNTRAFSERIYIIVNKSFYCVTEFDIIQAYHPRLYATAVISQHLDLTLLYADWTVVK